MEEAEAEEIVNDTGARRPAYGPLQTSVVVAGAGSSDQGEMALGVYANSDRITVHRYAEKQ